jgi:hypothetical protein
MSVLYKRIQVRASLGREVSGNPPQVVASFAQALDAAAPAYLYYPEEATSDDVHVLLLQAVTAKLGNVETSCVMDPTAGEGLVVDHVIDPVDSRLWTDISGTTYGVVYPVVAPDTQVYYVGFNVS